MPRRFAFPRQFRGTKDLENVIHRNMQALLTYMNTSTPAYEEDGSIVFQGAVSAGVGYVPSAPLDLVTVAYLGENPKPIQYGHVETAATATTTAETVWFSTNVGGLEPSTTYLVDVTVSASVPASATVGVRPSFNGTGQGISMLATATSNTFVSKRFFDTGLSDGSGVLAIGVMGTNSAGTTSSRMTIDFAIWKA